MLRVIGGTMRGLKLECPEGTLVRPTSARLREDLFNILSPRLDGALFLDLFAGTGAVGIEAVSRGAVRAGLVENSPVPLKAIRANVARTKMPQRFEITAAPVRNFLLKCGSPYDIIFLDPPYALLGETPAVIAACGRILSGGGVLVAEAAREFEMPETLGPLTRFRVKTASASALHFFSGVPDALRGSYD